MRKALCATLIATLSLLPLQAARAEMITLQDVSAVHTQSFSQRKMLVNTLEELGVQHAAAQERVAALSDEEAGQLAAQAASAPAGGNAAFLLIAIMVALVIMFNHSLHSK